MKHNTRKIDNDFSINCDVSFREVLSLLVSNNKATKQSDEQKLPKIVDTVFFRNSELLDLDEDSSSNGQDESIQYQHQFSSLFMSNNNCDMDARRDLIVDWFYTSSQGSLCRHKNPSSVPLQHVYERFSAIVDNKIKNEVVAIGLESPHNRDEMKHLSHGNSTSLLLRNGMITQDDFRRELKVATQDKTSCSVFSKFVGIQPYIQCHDPENRGDAYRVSFQSSDKSSACESDCSPKRCHSFDICILHNNGDTSSENSELSKNKACASSPTLERGLVDGSSSDSVCSSLKDSTLALVEYINAAVRKRRVQRHGRDGKSQPIGLKVESVVVDYVLDRNNTLWICNISNTRMGYQSTCDQESCIPIVNATLDKKGGRVHGESMADATHESKKAILKRQQDYDDREKKTHRCVRSESVQEQGSAQSLQRRITNLEVALANERKKNLDNESVISDLRIYRDEINRKLQKLETMFDGEDGTLNKDALGTSSVEPEGVDMRSFLDKLEGVLLMHSGRSLNFTQEESREDQIVASNTDKKIKIRDTRSELKDFTSTVFCIVHRRLLLWKYFTVKHWQTSVTTQECEKYHMEGGYEIVTSKSSPSYGSLKHEGECTVDQEGNLQVPHEEDSVCSNMSEAIDIGGIYNCHISESHLNENHRVAINRLVEMHRKDIDKIESAVENKLKLAVKRTEEACHRHHSYILNGLENTYREKEETIMQRLNQVHNQQLEALKAQYAQQLLEHNSSYRQRELNLRLEFDNELKIKLDVVKLFEQQEADRALRAALCECEDGWKVRVEAQAEEHAAALRKLEERHRSMIQEKIDSLIGNVKAQHLQREADLQEEYSIAFKNSIDKERKIHASEVRSLQEKYEQILLESDLKLKEYGETQYQKGLCENDSLYRANLEKLQNSANEALDNVKDVAKAQLEEFLKQNTSFMKLSMTARVKREIAANQQNSLKLAQCEGSNLDDRTGIVENSFTASVTKRQEERIDSIVENLDKFRELVWKEMIYKFNCASQNQCFAATKPMNESDGPDKKDGCVIKEVIDYVDKRCDEFRILIEKEIQGFTAVISEYEEWIERLEYETMFMRTQKETQERNKIMVERELHKCRQSHDREIVYLKRATLQSSIDKWVLVSRGLSKMNELKENAKVNESNHAQSMRCAIDDFNDCKRKMSLRIETLENAVSSFRERLMGIHDSILHHKRDTFLQQKSSSYDLSLQLDSIKSERESLEVMRSQLSNQLLSLEDHINDVERRIREHCKISAIQGGTVSEAHTGRKRRLDEEYDALVVTATRKRNELKVIEDKITNKTQAKEEIDNEMRRVERELVEILLEQQKMVLSLTS